MTFEQIKDNFEKIRYEILTEEKKSGRTENSVSLCAVSKFHPVQSVYDAMKSKQFLFGENRVQEAYEKFTQIQNDSTISKKPDLHIIGTLQKNKVKKAVEISSCIESVDREDLLVAIEKTCVELNKKINILFEFHTGEESKSGFLSYDSIKESVESCAKGIFPHIVPCGLMTMAPFTDNEILIHKSFESLRKTKDSLQKEFPNLMLNELSMGMSNDYKIAIEEGSTIVRIGTALFGQREAPLKN